jgi:hypothetical protein
MKGGCNAVGFLLVTGLLPALSSIASAEAVGGTLRDQSGGSIAGARIVLTEKSKQLFVPL